MSLLQKLSRPFTRGVVRSLAPVLRGVAVTLALTHFAAQPTLAQGNAKSPAPSVSAPSWVHESWTVKDGLPVNSTNDIIQDRAGYIWLATFDGLVRFDGLRFTVFNSANSEQLPSNRIVKLSEGRDGSLWLTTEQGHIVRFRDGQFTSLTFDNGKSAVGLAMIFQGSGDDVWVGNLEGLWKVRHDTLVRVGKGTLDARVSTMVQRRDGSLWIGTSAAGIFRLTQDGRLTKVSNERVLDSDFISKMIEDPSGTVWIAGNRALWSWKDSLVRIRGPEPRFFIQAFALVRATGELFAANDSRVFRIVSDSAVVVQSAHTAGARLWADSSAIWTVDGSDVLRDGQRAFTLPDRRTVNGVLFDREGSLWLGTDAGGLHSLRPALFTTYSLPEGVGHPNVYGTFVDHSGTVWLGTWGKGVTRVNPATGRPSVFVSATVPDFVNSFYEDKTGQMWIGVGTIGGLFACTPPAMTCRVDGPPSVRGKEVYALFGDAGGNMWVGAANVLARYDGRRWTTYGPHDGAPEAPVRAFASTRDGAVWMGTNGGGLTRFRDGKFQSLTRGDGLPSDLIRSLYEDPDGWLWVGTEGRGLVRLDPRAWADGRIGTKSALVRISTHDGLFDEVIHQILEDADGRLWMNTNRGIFWVTRAELNAFADGKVPRIHSAAYSERDGMRNREGNGGVQPAGAKGLDGRLWFPTQDGVVVVDPRQVHGDRRAPPLVVEQVVAGGNALRTERDSIALSPDQRDVQIEYTALTFLEPVNVRFRYRLDPYDADWVDVGNRRTAFYTKVPPGRYAFRVEASDAAGGWYEPGATLAIRVLPTIWETAIFRWVAIGALGILLLVAVRLREARLRARAIQLERTVDDRTTVLRKQERELADQNARLQSLDHAKTRFFANVSHEFRTPLTLTIGPLEDLRARAGGDPQIERWLDIALRNSRRLLRLVNQILDVAKLDAGAMHLAPRPLDLGPFTRGIVAAFIPVAERNGLSLTTETPDTLRGGFDSDAVEKILTNLLSNAIKFTPRGGAVHVALVREESSAQLLVSDTGPGIPADQLSHIFERFYQVDESTTRTQPGTGIGLSLVRELVELHGGKITVESGAAGTRFTATISSQPVGDAPQAVTKDEEDAVASFITVEQEGIAPEPAQDESREDVPTLLVVDDSADLRAYVRDHFAAQFRVVEAADGAEGIALARGLLPDVVLSDVMMPGTNGNELVRVLRDSTETDFLSIILLTAQAENEQRLQGLEHGADDYIVKPFEMRELDVRVRNLVASRRRLRERFAVPLAEVRDVVSDVAPVDRAYMTRLRDAIRQRLSDPSFGVGELADAVSQDRSHLFRRVKQLFGESPSDLIRRMRLEEGERLLTEGSATVSDVAYAVGFNSLSHFCRRFIEVYGVTPATYRTRSISTD